MLAALIATDPVAFGAVLGLHYDQAAVSVQREASVHSANRPDIVLTADRARIAVIEVKVLAGLGRRRLAVPLRDAKPWQEVTWETLLRAYESSDHSWAAATARAWCHHLDSVLPKVGPGTRWNDLRPLIGQR